MSFALLRSAPALTLVPKPPVVRARSPYLFPVPASVLRALLDAAAETGREFREDEAAADVMLAMDRDDLRPHRYYAKRWGWSASRALRLLDGLKAKAETWRAFNRLTSAPEGEAPPPAVKQAEAEVEQSEAETAPFDPVQATSEAGAKQAEAGVKQYRTDPDTRPSLEGGGGGDAGAHEAVPVVVGEEQSPVGAPVQVGAQPGAPSPPGSDLPESLAPFAAEAERLLAPAAAAELASLVCRALRVGKAPPELRALSEDHGRFAVAVALLSCDAHAEKPSASARLNYVRSVLTTIRSHADTLRTRAVAAAAGARVAVEPSAHAGGGERTLGPGDGAPAPPGAGGRGRTNGAGEVHRAEPERRTASERRGSYGYDDARAAVEAARAQRRARAGNLDGAQPGGGGGDDAAGDGGGR